MLRHRFQPLISCQALGQARPWFSLIKGEGDSVDWFFLVSLAFHLWIADQVRNDGMRWEASSYSAWHVHPALWFPAFAGMTVRDVGMTWAFSVTCEGGLAWMGMDGAALRAIDVRLYLWTRPLTSPPATDITSDSDTKLKSPCMVCARAEAATAKSNFCLDDHPSCKLP